MRLVPLKHCRPGMKLGKPVISPEGHVLVGYRVELNSYMIQRLLAMGCEYVYVHDPHTEDIHIEDAIREETRAALRSALSRVCQVLTSMPAAVLDGRISLFKLCGDSVTALIRDVSLSDNDTIALISAPRQTPSDFIQHFIQNALNVSVYAAKIGAAEGYSDSDLAAFILGAMLHDIGNFAIRTELLRKPSRLTAEEFGEIKRHTTIGYELLAGQPGIALDAAVCALQHHERIDGSGYHRLKGPEIHPFAQWVGLLDAYDALTHPRAYRKAYLPHEAMEILYTFAVSRFHPAKIERFRNKTAIFPVGLSVSLNTGEKGIVSKLNPSCKHRPVVRVLYDAAGARLAAPYEVDLSANLTVMISQIGDELGALA